MSTSRPPAPANVSRTQELILAPQIRDFRTRGRLLAAAIVAPLLVVAAVWTVRHFSAIDRALAAEGANAVRTIVYEVPRAGSLVVAIEPDTDLLRFIVSAYRHGEPLPLTPLRATLTVVGNGARKRRSEEVVLELPGIRTHITAEDPALAVADPAAFSFDVHDLGVGEVTLTLKEATDADGVLVRAYRREHLATSDATFRNRALDAEQKDRLAIWAWEPGWNEIAAAERDALLTTRWRKIGAARGPDGELRIDAVAFSPPPARVMARHDGVMLGNVSIRAEERAAILVHGATSLRASSDAGIRLHAVVRSVTGDETHVDGLGLLEVNFVGDDVRGLEVWSDEEAIVAFRSQDPAPLAWLGYASAYRAEGTRGLEIACPDGARAIRVSARRPLERRGMPRIPIAIRADVEELAGHRRISTRTFAADVPRSRVDRYDGDDPAESPTERATFFVRVPKGARARLTSVDGTPVDITLAELDESAPPEALETRAPEADLPRFEIVDEPTWAGFVPRRPSNLADFDARSRKILRLGHTVAERPLPKGIPAVAHVKHRVTRRTEKDGRRFDAIDQPFEIQLDAARPLFVPIVVYAEERARLVIELDADPQHPPRPGLAAQLTRARSVEVAPGFTRTTFTIGDDIPAGHPTLRISSASKGVLVLLPWASARPYGPRWLGGAFEE